MRYKARENKCQKWKVKKLKTYEKTDTDPCFVFYSASLIQFVRRSIYHWSRVFIASAGFVSMALRIIVFFAVIYSRYICLVRYRIICTVLRRVYTTKGWLLVQCCWVDSGDAYQRIHSGLLVVVLAICRVWDLYTGRASAPLSVADNLADGRLPAPNNVLCRV